MKIVFLGTGSMVPTKERNHSAILLSYKDENILIDCGEGTQRQFRYMGLSPAKISRILITHWHGDHVLGLPGLLSNMDKLGHVNEIEIYGPRGSKTYFNNMMRGVAHKIEMKIKVIEISKTRFFETRDFYLEALTLGHHPECLGYNFIEKDKHKINMDYLKKTGIKAGPELKKLQQGKSFSFKGEKIDLSKATKLIKGKKVSFIMDTGFCGNILKLAKNSNLFISEATFSSEIKDKAEKYNHLTAEQAGKIAKQANVRKLVITHFSQRYKDISCLIKEVKKNFKNVAAAEDFMVLEL